MKKKIFSTAPYFIYLLLLQRGVSSYTFDMGTTSLVFLIGIFLGAFIAKSSLFSSSYKKKKPYIVSLELSSVDILNQIDELLSSLPLKIKNKHFLRSDTISLVLHFDAPPIVQHVLIKRLCVIEGITKIAKL